MASASGSGLSPVVPEPEPRFIDYFNKKCSKYGVMVSRASFSSFKVRLMNKPALKTCIINQLGIVYKRSTDYNCCGFWTIEFLHIPMLLDDEDGTVLYKSQFRCTPEEFSEYVRVANLLAEWYEKYKRDALNEDTCKGDLLNIEGAPGGSGAGSYVKW